MITIVNIVGFILFCLWYCLLSYLNYRIVAKFDSTTSFLENLIPIWSNYILIRQVMSIPGIYIFFVGMVCVNLTWIGFATGLFIRAANFNDFTTLSNQNSAVFSFFKSAYTILAAYQWGKVAQALRKSFWLHAILALFSIPLIITIPIMAFGKSCPARREM